MYVVFDLSDDKNGKRAEYKMENVDFIPRIGEEISLSNGIETDSLSGMFKVNNVEYDAYQLQLKKDQRTGKGRLKGVRVYASKE